MKSTNDQNLGQMPPFDDPEPGQTWFVSLLSIIILSVLVLAICVLYFGVQWRFIDETEVNLQAKETMKLRQEQQEMLSVYEKYQETDESDQVHTRIRIPINRSMEILVAESRSQAMTDSDNAERIAQSEGGS